MIQVLYVLFCLQVRVLGVAAALFFSVFSARVRADAFPLPTKTFHEASEVVPRGWALESSLTGDLDGDGSADLVLVLLQDENDNERERGLVLLLKTPGGYELAGTNLGLVSCFQCMGVKSGDGQPGVKIKRRVLTIEQIGGSREWYGSVHRFRWNVAAHRLELIGLDTSSGDGMTGEQSVLSTNLLTGRCVETRTPPQVDEEGRELHVRTRSKRSRLKKAPLLALEAVRSAFE